MGTQNYLVQHYLQPRFNMYSFENIVWIKNVKRDKGSDWAYSDVSCDKTFFLHWPTSKKGSASTAKVGDIIVLFQKPNIINGKRNSLVHMTHLVSPVSDTTHTDNNVPNYQWCREVKLIAIAKPIQSIPNPGYYNFFKPNRGLTNPIVNLTNNISMTEAQTKENIWRLFQNHFCNTIASEIFQPQEPNGIFGEVEGDKIIREHIKQELTRRNSRIVQLAKSNALVSGNGNIKCECCTFDFFLTYGKLGERFIECHHKVYISAGKRITQITDLALVCSNCHRMLHRKRDDNTYHTIDTLRELISSRSTKSE